MKNIKTIIIIILVAGLGYLAYNLTQNDGSGAVMATEALSDFAIKDTSSIDKLVITDTEGNPGVTLMRVDDEWQSAEYECIQQHLVTTILETIKYIKVKSPVPEGAIENTNKNIAAHHKKMEIYENGKLSKTWYIGNPTQDQYGTYMLLKDPAKGKSPEPFIMHLPNMYGNLSTRFVTDPREFECTEVFRYDPLSIQTIEVTQPDSSFLNFKIEALNENLFEVYNNDKKLIGFDTSRVRGYLVQFKKIHFEGHNYGLTKEMTDSIKSSTPYFTIEVNTKAGEQNAIRLFRRKYVIDKVGLDGELLEYDQDRLWVQLNDGRLVVGQFYVFGRLMQDIRFFGGEVQE